MVAAGRLRVLSGRPELLTETPARGLPMDDALSQLVRQIRLQGAFFINGVFHEPWCVDAPPAARFAPLLCPGAPELAILHMVLEGRCWVHADGSEPMELVAGDVVAFPHGDAHRIGSGVRHAPVELQHVVNVRLPELAQVRYGGDGQGTVLVCGWFAYERDVPHPLLAALPRMFRVQVGNRRAGPWLEQSIRYALQEAAAGTAGSDAMAAKIAEALFVETVRGYLETLSGVETGWFAAVRDPQVARCLALMHGQPARDWSVELLAREVHLSRSVLADRFTALLGVPPMQYLKRWRLGVAARLLRGERTSVIQVAEAVGYESEASFSRAFKGEYGVPPGLWRSGGEKGA
jgi:AraC family transcriptional regulator, alkane utilization regulator